MDLGTAGGLAIRAAAIAAALSNPASEMPKDKSAKAAKADRADPEYVEESDKKKRKKRTVEPEPEEPEVDDEAGEAPADPNDEEAKRKRLTKLRQNKRARGYRAKAKQSGGEDLLATCISAADAKRLMQFAPEVLSKSTFTKEECLMRMGLGKESVPQSAARETLVRVEAVMRHVMKEAVMRASENGTQGVDAKAMHAVLRRYQPEMLFTAVLPPKGLVRHAQNEGALVRTDFDTDEKRTAAEKKENKELHAEAQANEKAMKALKAARAAKLAAKPTAK